MRTLLTFEDVLLVPKYSDIRSRADIDLSTNFLGMKFDLPIISANMDYVTESGMAAAMIDNGGFYVLHRFYPPPRHELEGFLDDVDLLVMNGRPISISVGVRDPEEEIAKVERVSRFGGGILDILTVTVDVAHGHHNRVANMVQRLKMMGVQRVIAGNVATPEGYKFLAEAGADAVKVGIGPGSVCTTREVAGVGVPQIGALMDIADVKRHAIKNKLALSPIAQWTTGIGNVKPVDPYRWPAIIADGGMKSSGDIVKALAAGADMVMLGSLLAGTKEAPGERRLELTTGKRYKRYRGQSIFGVNASHYTPEGIEGWVPEGESVKEVLQRLGAGIRSGLSYVGARNLKELREKAEFIQITQAGYLIESATRIENGDGL